MVLFDRNNELACIPARIWSPRETGVGVTGKYGIGKSSFLAVIPAIHGARAVTFHSIPSQSDRPFSGLTMLLREIDDCAFGPILDRIAAWPADKSDLAALSSTLLITLQQRSLARTVVLIDDAASVDMSATVISNVPEGEPWAGVPAHAVGHGGFKCPAARL